MTDMKKVIKGLECCLGANECDIYPKEECPYNGMALCAMCLEYDVMELLKAQRPRVMTLEEVKRLFPGADVWIEYHDLTGWKIAAKIAAITVREISDNGLLGEFQSLRYSFDRYGRYNGDWLAWRCWTSRPTDEQREATSWPS